MALQRQKVGAGATMRSLRALSVAAALSAVLLCLALPSAEGVKRIPRCFRDKAPTPCPKPRAKSSPLRPQPLRPRPPPTLRPSTPVRALVPLSSWPANLTGAGTGHEMAAKPLMGWNTYNQFPMGVNETLLKQMADALVSLGLAQLGYTLVSIDDDWAAWDRDVHKNLQPNPQRYPSGIESLADFMHSRGLKLGIYSDAGARTCHKSQPGSLNFEDKDARLFASWKIDYLKYDNCNGMGIPAGIRFGRMSQAVRRSGRDMHFNLCTGGAYAPATWARTIADSWRTAGDQRDEWATMIEHAAQNDAFAQYAGPGGFNDLDALEVGNGGMSLAEYRVMFSLWGLMKSPLILGCDLRTVSKAALQIIKNKEVIGINQDLLGIQGRRVVTTPLVEVWAGPLVRDRLVVGFVNKDNTTARVISATWLQLRLSRQSNFRIRSVWEGKTFTRVRVGQWQYKVAPHDIALFIFTPVPSSGSGEKN